jgi:MFS family permease
MNFTVLEPPYARDQLGVGATGYGFLMAASGLGSLCSAIGIAFLRGPKVRILIGGALLLGALDAALGFSTNYALALAFMFGVGMGGIAMAMTANATIQLGVPDQLRGRVMAVYTTTFAGSTPIGGLITGAIASWYGASAGLLFGGVLTVIAALVAAAYVLRSRRAAEIPLVTQQRTSQVAPIPQESTPSR